VAVGSAVVGVRDDAVEFGEREGHSLVVIEGCAVCGELGEAFGVELGNEPCGGAPYLP
jgi:hypothetical protein